jgi:hypothetical protein
MYFVIRPFENMSDAMSYCAQGSVDSILTDNKGTVLMKHQEVPLDESYALMITKTFLEITKDLGENTCSCGLEKS